MICWTSDRLGGSGEGALERIKIFQEMLPAVLGQTNLSARAHAFLFDFPDRYGTGFLQYFQMAIQVAVGQRTFLFEVRESDSGGSAGAKGGNDREAFGFVKGPDETIERFIQVHIHRG